MESPTPLPVQPAPKQTAPAPAVAQPAPAAKPAVPPNPAGPAKPQRSYIELQEMHDRAHKKLTIVETVGVVLLIFAILTALAGWAYYEQTQQAASQPYSFNEYR